MAMTFEEMQQRIDFFNSKFKDMTKSVEEFIKSLEGGDSSRFAAFIKQLSEIQELAVKENKLKQEYESKLKAELEIQEKLNKLKKIGKSFDDKEELELKQSIERQESIIKNLEKINEELKKQDKNMEDLNDSAKFFADGTQKVLDKFKLFNYRGSGIFKIMDTFRKGGDHLIKFKDGMSVITGKIQDAIDPLNILSGLFNTVVKSTAKMVMSLNDSLKAFQHHTGIVGIYNDTIYDAYATNLQYSVSLDTTREATEALVRNMQSFNLTSMENRKGMIELVALYEKFGASTFELGEMLGRMSDTFKLNAEGAKNLLEQLRGLHNNIGGTFREIIDNYNDSANRLARFGINGMNKAFKELSVVARSLHIEFKELFKITDQFDTFESAAAAVGRFNAIAGGPYLNAIALMKQSDDERAKSLIGAIKAANINYDLLSAQEKQALATSIGISDMTTAQKIFTGSLSDYYRLRNITNEKEKEAQAKAKEMASIQDKLNTIFESFATLIKPVLSALAWFLGGVRDIVVLLTKDAHPAIMTFATLIGGFLVFKLLKLILTFTKFSTLFSGFFSKIGSTIMAPLKGLITFFSNLAPEVFKASGSIVAFSVAIGAAALAVWGIAKAIQALKEAFASKGITANEASIVERLSSSSSATNIKLLSESLGGLSSTVNGLDFIKLEKLSSVLEEIGIKAKELSNPITMSITRNIADLFEAASKVTNVNTTEIKNMVTEIVRLNHETDETKIIATKDLLSSTNQPQSVANSARTTVENKIILDGNILSRWMSSEINKIRIDVGNSAGQARK